MPRKVWKLVPCRLYDVRFGGVQVRASQGRRGRDTGSYVDRGERSEVRAWASRNTRDRGDRVLDTRRMKVAATIEPGGDVGAPAFWRGQLWMLTGLHLVSIDQKTNRVVERAAIHGPGNAAVADGTLWDRTHRSSSGSALPDERTETGWCGHSAQ
jgi:hypothetical protein